ncbi:MAG: YfhO family protein [Dermatophilaceae bacterium]
MTQDSPDQTPASRFGWVAPAALSGLLAAAVFCAVTALRDLAPFGAEPRGLNDLGNQFVPFHAYLWDLLHGRVDLVIAWNVGLGVPFLPDYAAYLASPFAPLVALFPRDEIDTAVFVITTLKLAVAAAVMTAYLLVLRRSGSRLLAAGLGAAYAVCGWALDDADYVTMWLDGLIALPAIALAMERLRLRGRLALAALVVALFWWANPYTAVMATLGAGTLVLARVVAESPTVRGAVADLARSLLAVVLGVATTGVLLLTFLSAVSRAQDSPERPFTPYPWVDVLARSLPLTGGVGRSPGLYVGTVVLVLALSLPFLPVTLRRRLTYTVGGVLVMLSMQWPPTQLVWHAFDPPNGSQFRAAFAMAAWIVVVAWVAAEALPRRPLGLLGGVGLVATLAWWAGGTQDTDEWTRTVAWAVCAVLGAIAVGLFAARGRERLRRIGLAAVAAVLIAGVLVEGTWTGVVSGTARAARFVTYPDAGPIMATVEASVQDRPVLPEGRVAGPQEYGRNEAYLLGIPGVEYYSSMISADHSAGLRELGVVWTSNGLSVRVGPDRGLRALLGVQTELGADGEVIWTSSAAPLARRIPGVAQASAPGSVFEARNALAGAELYAVPGVAVDGTPGGDTPVTVTAGDEVTLTVICPARSVPTLNAPQLVGSVAAGGKSIDYPRGFDVAPPRELGVSTGDPLDLTVRATAESELPADPVGCLDPAVLESLTTEPSPDIRLSGSSIQVTWPEPSEATAVVSVPAYAGWRCATDGSPAQIRSLHGLLSVPLAGARELTCDYRQPGLLPGMALTVVALLALAAVGLLSRRRSHRESPAGASPHAPADASGVT